MESNDICTALDLHESSETAEFGKHIITAGTTRYSLQYCISSFSIQKFEHEYTYAGNRRFQCSIHEILRSCFC